MNDELDTKRAPLSGRAIGLIVIAVILVWFMLVNRDDVNVTFLLGDGYDVPLALALILAAALGFVIGYFVAVGRARSRRKS